MFPVYKETILHIKEKSRCTTNDQINTYDTRITSYYQYMHKLHFYNSKHTLVSCNFCETPYLHKTSQTVSLKGN